VPPSTVQLSVHCQSTEWEGKTTEPTQERRPPNPSVPTRQEPGRKEGNPQLTHAFQDHRGSYLTLDNEETQKANRELAVRVGVAD